MAVDVTPSALLNIFRCLLLVVHACSCIVVLSIPSAAHSRCSLCDLSASMALTVAKKVSGRQDLVTRALSSSSLQVLYRLGRASLFGNSRLPQQCIDDPAPSSGIEKSHHM
ncbi:hypothetical protein EDD36DRAFT_87976 [Exophiala viscosa]|uniref:Uncharacterized protein n=1 Tax=Exophiala viscosa TaxID=2486360 RepID=A0AAN6DQ11_9EURO|nr:hypothetical protein EDD36DRAFT_87976 [Exophiala viscosa]